MTESRTPPLLNNMTKLDEFINLLLNTENGGTMTTTERTEWMMREVAKWTYWTIKPPKFSMEDGFDEYGKGRNDTVSKIATNAREAGIITD